MRTLKTLECPAGTMSKLEIAENYYTFEIEIDWDMARMYKWKNVHHWLDKSEKKSFDWMMSHLLYQLLPGGNGILISKLV